jgi:hypothetical protein
MVPSLEKLFQPMVQPATSVTPVPQPRPILLPNPRAQARVPLRAVSRYRAAGIGAAGGDGRGESGNAKSGRIIWRIGIPSLWGS